MNEKKCPPHRFATRQTTGKETCIDCYEEETYPDLDLGPQSKNPDYDEEALVAFEQKQEAEKNARAEEFARKVLGGSMTNSERSAGVRVARAALEAAGKVLSVREAEQEMRSSFAQMGVVLILQSELDELLAALEANGQRKAYPTDSPKVKRIKDASQALRERVFQQGSMIKLTGRKLDEPES